MPSCFRFCRFYVFLAVCLAAIVQADQNSCTQEIAALRQRVAQIEQLLKIDSVDDESPLLQHVSDYNISETTIVAMKSLSVPVPVMKNDRQTLQPVFLVAVATSNGKLSLYSENNRKIVEAQLPISCDLLTIGYESGDENLLAIGGCETVHIATVTVWQDALGRDLRGSVAFEMTLASTSAPITSIYVQNHRYLKQFTVGTGTAELLVYTRNGTLRYQERTEKDSFVVSAKQQRPRHLTYATATEIGFVRTATSTYSPEICSLVDDTDEFASFTHNPKKVSVLYAGTKNGRLLVFDIHRNRHQRNTCGLRFDLELGRGFGLSVSAVSDYVFAASARSLFVLNVTGDPLTNLKIVSSIPLHFSNSSQTPLLSAVKIKNHVRLSIAERGGAQVRTFLLNVTPETITQTLSLPRAPIFLFIMIGTLVYQFGRKKLGKNNTELTDEDKRMIDSIIKRSQFDTCETVEGDPYDSSKASSLRHRHSNYKPRQGETPSLSRPSDSSCDEEDCDEGRLKKIK